MQEVAFSGALATDMLVGRTQQLEQIRAAMGPEAGQVFQCILLQAPGGRGKTRLLNKIAEESSDQVIILPLIDVADPQIHTVVEFLREVRAGFALYEASAEVSFFASFDETIQRYDIQGE